MLTESTESVYQEFIHGYAKYESDVSSIRWLVSRIKDLLQHNCDELPNEFNFTVILCRQSARKAPHSIMIKKRDEKNIGIILLQPITQTIIRSTPWDQIEWSPFGDHMPPAVAQGIAKNLNRLIISTGQALESASAEKSLNALNSTIKRGKLIISQPYSTLH